MTVHARLGRSRPRRSRTFRPDCAGTRIAVKVLFDYLEDGQSVDDFVRHYPSVSREQAVAALDEVKERLEATA